MQRTHSELDRFLCAAHRRWVAWRALERVGLSTLGACALSLPLVAVCWSRGEPALGIVAVALSLGACVGAAWGIVRRPTLLETAVEADRQFNLHDLLGTALTLTRCAHADGATRATVAALADERCRHLAASRLVLNRLGARTWGGIGLATALVLTLALMTASPAPTAARAGDADASLPSMPAPQPHATPRDDARTSPDRRAASTGSPNQDNALPRGEAADVARQRQHSSQGAATGAPASGVGAGRAAGGTESGPSRAPKPVAPMGDRATGSTPAAGGGGTPETAPFASDDASSGVARSVGSAHPPWRASTWETDRNRALRNVERGAVPDAYRDLVRAYFQEN